MGHKVYIALGSNLGERESNLRNAVEHISNIDGLTVDKLSHIYETDPVGYLEQDRFLNMVIAAATDIEPLELLGKLQGIEDRMGRTREIHWGPRTMDIDMLIYGDKKINLPCLKIPHPQMLKRAFVLIPFKDVYDCPEVLGADINKLIQSCGDRDGIKLYRKSLLTEYRLRKIFMI
ncbi:2-amino-4-hydroxy-6-hydroxymethyldihydropteridine diphosphokinase [Anaerobacterium chartisolvens]|uniref:2-amino-4-hydroxy-6-hydroxymethyldihydropteridine diphosphokinase n=1 Tax=Anaerobacterium chartisolvens TaxID=1297424 RepID=A0A369ASM3_9FIRM|nr:2-amino-4-hydroxy-6-hydroxymethyldihydropteridine diphosphokinase [Anaerobacterium chartisolvens]RCX11266.1 2-amino-4-hydroxy-6-hydroxymethyldihydropteridine diphosphokinase [Anaerobacterium chartisolvens]